MAEKKKITKKVISKAPVKEVEVSKQKEEVQKEDVSRSGEATPKVGEAGRTKKVCFFDQSKTEPSYTDMNTLRRFVTDRAKIVPKLRSGLCSKHQRVVTRHIKYARHLALFPFTPKV